MYIFTGDVSTSIMNIFKKMAELSFYDTLLKLEKKEYDTLVKNYGDNWFSKFFNTYHIDHTIHMLNSGSLKKAPIIEKYGQPWYKTHIESHQLLDYKLIYSYEALIKEDYDRKISKKGKRVIEDDIDVDYRTRETLSTSKIGTDIEQKRLSGEKEDEENTNIVNGSDLLLRLIKQNNDRANISTFLNDTDTSETSPLNKLIGGGDDEMTEPDDDDEEEIDVDIDSEIGQTNKDGDKTGDKASEELDEFERGLDSDVILADEELDLDEMEKLYQDVDTVPDDNLVKTSALIQDALKDDKLFKKIDNSLIQFDITKDDQMYDDHLKNVYKKHYITNQYIFKDDTIKMIKNKICCSLKNNEKFGGTSYITPSRQYLWSEYYYNEKVEKVMIGQKWMRRNELLQIDVEPNTNIRIYEELRGKLKLLRDNIKRYGSKIKREDDDYNILYDYDGYFSNNEIYMIDLYNEFGKGYNPDSEELKNIIDVYMRIYFPRIKSDDVKYILEYLQTGSSVEENKLKTTYETIMNDLVLENEIMKDVEEVKKHSDFQYIFKDNYITQSVIHVNLRIKEGKLDLHRIFNEFIPNNNYPFTQFQTPDGQTNFKYSEDDITNYQNKRENLDVLVKWFENSPYGISFKVRITEKNVEKFMAINLNENGRIEYKTQWKEEDMATIEDIKNTYNHVKELINKINGEKNRIKFEIPLDQEFRYAFINTIQKFELPDKFVINHNDLSEFSRYFFPYVALVIEPRKRQSKIKKDDNKSKFGTYLRYKRVSKYENQARIEQRILYFMRNYDYNDQSLASEISKQFNITEERAMEEIEKVRGKYPNIKKSRKILKKLENIPKYKPPGIGIDIQGKQREKYKIRISGARDKQQLDRIINFMNILIYLYVDTYLYKKKDRQILKDKLSKLTKIARRRNRVDDVVDYNRDVKTVKQMTQLDKKRIGFKPEKGQNQWTRSCQNSGTDKKRRPQQYTNQNFEELNKKGYKFNNKTGMYEKKITLKGRGGKKTETLIRAVKLLDLDEGGNLTGNDVYYTCSPNENGDHMYVGFLTRSNNPYGHCMPCCFKKDPMISKNKEKREYFLKCIGEMNEKPRESNKIVGDRLYILQDTNKIQEGRFGFLPKYLDFFFNTALSKTRSIKHHYLITSKTGYYFKYGSRQDEFPFLNAVSSILNLTIDEIKSKICKTLENDKSNQIFTSLNNGDIKTQFIERQNYINFINNNMYLDFDIINNIISLPNVLHSQPINIVVFQKVVHVIKKSLEKEKIKEDFVIMCQNLEEPDNIIQPDRITIFMLKENRNYYPIVEVIKDDENTKDIIINKTFKYQLAKNNLVSHVADFYQQNCYEGIMSDISESHTSILAKSGYRMLNSMSDKKYHTKFQMVDTRNKCRYLIINSGLIVPVKASGSIFNLQIIKNIDKYIQTFDATLKQLNELYDLTKKLLPVKPVGVYFEKKEKKNNKIQIVAITTRTYDVIPVIPEWRLFTDIKDLGLVIENRPLYDKIDKEITKGPTNFTIDDRILMVNYRKYYNESYEMFRLHFSEFINKEENKRFYDKFVKLIKDKKHSKADVQNEIRRILYKLVDKDLSDIYESSLGNKRLMSDTDDDIDDETDDIDDDAKNKNKNKNKKIENDDSSDYNYDIDFNQEGGKIEKLVHIVNKLPDLIGYDVSNNRDLCWLHDDKNGCSISKHCYWTYNSCHLAMTKQMAVEFVNRLSEEIFEGGLKMMELFRIGDYFVSDIVDYQRFTERKGQKIIKSTNSNLKKVLSELFGKENIPIIGKRRTSRTQDINLQQVNLDNQIKDMQDFYVQNVIHNNNTIFRAYVNSIYWLKHPYDDVSTRNIGYFSQIQTDLTNYFKSSIIDWLLDKKRRDEINDNLLKYIVSSKRKNIVREFVIKLASDNFTFTDGVVELYVLSRIYKIPIVVYNENNTPIYIFDNGIVYHKQNNIGNQSILNKYTDKTKRINCINLRLNMISNTKIADEVESLYFK
jgi:hypothetical protein